MHSILIYISLGLTAVYLTFFTLKIIFSFKNNNSIKFLFEILQSVFLTLAFSIFLTVFLPQSQNLMRISLTAIILSYTGFFLEEANSKKKIQIFGTILILAGSLQWLEILFPSFKLFKVSTVALVISTIIYLGLGFLYFLLILKRRSLKKELLNLQLILTILKTATSCICHFASIITILYEHNLFSLLFFLGMTCQVLSFLFEIAFKLKETSLKCQFLYKLLFNLSVLLNCGAIILMLTN